MATSRQALIEAGTRRLMASGYHGTGVQAVLDDAGLPKGSFYHHFEGKEEFVIEVVRAWFSEQAELLRRSLTGAPPLAGLERYFVALADDYEGADWRSGCLLGSLGEEIAIGNEPIRAELDRCFADWRTALAEPIRSAKAGGDIATDADPGELAEVLIAAWEGALIQAKVARDRGPLDRFHEHAFRRLLSQSARQGE